MRPLPQDGSKGSHKEAGFAKARGKVLPFLVLLATGAWTLGCGGGGAGSVAPPPPPPPLSVSVTVTPASGSVLLGNTQLFIATVSNSADTAVSWSVNGAAGGNAASGTITADGVYTAPADLPSPATVQVAATSHADPTKSATTAIIITSDVVLAISPGAASVELGATQNFRAAITSSGHPDTAVRWSVSSTACPSACGTVDASGNYTAPQILPAPASATVTAQSAADPVKRASTTLTITSSFSLQLTGPSSVPAGASATIVAMMTPVPGSNPSTVLAFSLSGPGCSGSSCGTLTAITTQSAAGNAAADSATYIAPGTPPSPNTVTVTVTSQADPSKQAQTQIAIQPGVNVGLSPTTATLAANHRLTLAAQVNGTTNSSVSWSVNGVPGGNTTAGQLCAVSSSPCQTVTSGSVLQADYVAPGALPQPNPVTVQVTSTADPTKSATAQITVINHVLVSVQPQSAALAPLAVKGFTATVLGTANQSVVWQVQGPACTGGGVCGSITANGTYTAPAAAPSPDAIQIVTISSDDTTQSSVANVTISTGANILTLHPASVYAGAANGFTLRVDGSGFVATSPGPGSALLIAGTARTTTCTTASECTAPVTPADVAAAGSITVQIQNPTGTKSNAVPLVVAAANVSDEVISLTSALAVASGKDIVVVEPTTAGVSMPGADVDLNVAALGAFSVTNNSCALGGNPIAIMRPAAGTATSDICLFAQSGLDSSMAFTVSGPGDVTVISKQPAGLGIIHLTLQIPATALTGARTLFIQSTNLDKTAASGALVIR